MNFCSISRKPHIFVGALDYANENHHLTLQSIMNKISVTKSKQMEPKTQNPKINLKKL